MRLFDVDGFIEHCLAKDDFSEGAPYLDLLDRMDVTWQRNVSVGFVTGDRDALKQERIALAIDDLPVRRRRTRGLKVFAEHQVEFAILLIQVGSAPVNFDAFEHAGHAHVHHHSHFHGVFGLLSFMRWSCYGERSNGSENDESCE